MSQGGVKEDRKAWQKAGFKTPGHKSGSNLHIKSGISKERFNDHKAFVASSSNMNNIRHIL